MMKYFFKRNKYSVIGVIFGVAVGFGYWYFIGCTSGTCLITSKPLNSSLYGAGIFGIMFSFLDKKACAD